MEVAWPQAIATMDSDAVEVVDIEEDAYMAKPVAVDRHWRVEKKKKKPFRPIRSTISALLRYVYVLFTREGSSDAQAIVY